MPNKDGPRPYPPVLLFLGEEVSAGQTQYGDDEKGDRDPDIDIGETDEDGLEGEIEVLAGVDELSIVDDVAVDIGNSIETLFNLKLTSQSVFGSCRD